MTGSATQVIRDADLILSLDWIDLGGTLRQAGDGELPRSTVVQCSVDQYVHNGHNMDHQALPPTDLSILAPPDTPVSALLATLGPRSGKPIKAWFVAPTEAVAVPSEPPDQAKTQASDRLPLADMARVTTETLAPHRPSYIRLPLGWPGEFCRFAHPLDYIGFDGSGGIGSRPGMAVGRRWRCAAAIGYRLRCSATATT